MRLPRPLAWLSVALGLISTASPQVVHVEPAPLSQQLDIQGHRGCRGLRPENSMAAFEHALELGVTTLELDVRLTRDRVLVVHHDERVDSRLCVHDDGRRPVRAPIAELLFDDLAEFDCGSLPHKRFPAQRSAPGSRIPRLDDVLALATRAGYPVRLNIEIKVSNRDTRVEDAARELVALLERHRLELRTTVQSFDPRALLAVHDLAPDLPRAILVKARRDYARLVDAGRANILSPEFKQLRPEDVQRFHQRGVAVVPWTVNDPETIRRLIHWGVDGIISDYPDRVIAVWNETRASLGLVDEK